MKKLLVLLMALAIGITSLNSVYAQIDYKDVKEDFWAVPYIQKMADLKIITGYSDGRYGPNDKVTKYVAMLVSYRTLDSQGLIPEAQKEVLKNRYQSAITKYNVPNWPGLHEAVGYFVENDIIKPEELEAFTKDGKSVDISREEMSLFLGKALNVYFKDNVNDIIVPKFKDHADIDFGALKYVNILNNHNVISGNQEGFFLPKNNLTRAELAKMLSRSIDELKKISAVEQKEIKAVVEIKLDDTKHVVFYEVNSRTKSYREKIYDSVEIIVDGKKASYDDLKLDMVVNLVYKNDKLIQIIALENETKLDTLLEMKGIVNGIADSDKKYLYVKMDTGEVKFYEVDPNSEIVGDGNQYDFKDLTKGDAVTFGLDKNIIKKIEVKKQNLSMMGILEAISVEDTPTLTIKIADNSKAFPMASDVVVERNGARKTVGDLIVGDEIKIEITLGEVVKIVATGSTDKDRGYIAKVVLGNSNQIVIKDVNGNESNYKIAKNAAVYVDDELKSSYDLRINYAVSIKLENSEIVELRAKSAVEKSHAVGKIVTKYDDLKILAISVDDVNYTVNMKSDTVFIDKLGNKTTFNKLKEADTVFAYGMMQDKIISADSVIILETSN